MDLMLRKRLAIHVYKKQSIADKIKKKIQRQDSPGQTGVTYEVVSNIPKASEDPENRETLALMAASGEDALTSDGESYIEKYTRGVSAVESILMLDRLRQEVAVKELLAAQGRPLRKTSSVPNISHIMRMEPIPAKLEQQSRADSACELSSLSPIENIEFRKRSSSLKDGSFLRETSAPTTPVGSPFGLARPTFLNLSFNLNTHFRQSVGTAQSSTLGGMTPQSAKAVKPMTTLIEEQSLKDSRNFQNNEQSEDSGDETSKRKSPNKLDGSEEDLLDTFKYRGELNFGEKGRRLSETPDSTHDSQNKTGTPSMMSSGYDSQILSTTPASSEDSISLHSASEDYKDSDCTAETSAFINEDEQNMAYNQSNDNFIADIHNNNFTQQETKHSYTTNGQPVKPGEDLYENSQADGEISTSPKTLSSQMEMKFPAWLTVGESVMISPYNKTGVAAYLGPTHFAPGPWAGVELDTPTGKNDGTVNGIRYFECKPKFGIFVRPDKLVADSRGRAMRAARNQLHSNGNDGATKRGRNTKIEGNNGTDTAPSKNLAKARSRSRDPKNQLSLASRTRK